MIVGTLIVELYIGEANNLKDKRRVLKSIIDRIKNRYNVSVAEVGRQHTWQRATLGIACISNETTHVQSTLSNVAKFIESLGIAQVLAIETEII
ncbi:DUF503 domain-containing protein [Peptococcaceae bacterium 1198_IL3148]